MIGNDPLHVPRAPLRDWPDCAVPEIDGSTVTAAASPLTVAVAVAVATAVNAPEVAVTSTRNVAPTSARWSASVVLVAPATATHETPPLSHFSQRRAKLETVPFQVPSVAVRVDPSCAVPLTVGRVAFVGAGTTDVTSDVPLAVPPPLLKVRVERSVTPMSATARAYVREVAPAIAAQEAPAALQRSH